MKKIQILLLACLMIFVWSCDEEKDDTCIGSKLNLTLIDNQGNTNIDDATIEIFNSSEVKIKSGISTDGLFTADGIAKGTYDVTVAKTGYETLNFELIVDCGETKSIQKTLVIEAGATSSLKLISSDTLVVKKIDKSIPDWQYYSTATAHAEIVNQSNKDIEVDIELIFVGDSNHSFSFCNHELCYTDLKENWKADNPTPWKAGQNDIQALKGSEFGFELKLSPNRTSNFLDAVAGTTEAIIRMTNKADSTDFLDVKVKFVVEVVG